MLKKLLLTALLFAAGTALSGSWDHRYLAGNLRRIRVREIGRHGARVQRAVRALSR
jgi:hypothetical protein